MAGCHKFAVLKLKKSVLYIVKIILSNFEAIEKYDLFVLKTDNDNNLFITNPYSEHFNHPIAIRQLR